MRTALILYNSRLSIARIAVFIRFHQLFIYKSIIINMEDLQDTIAKLRDQNWELKSAYFTLIKENKRTMKRNAELQAMIS